MNPNLLQITSIPIGIAIKVTSGQLLPAGGEPPQISVHTGEGGLEVSAAPADLNIDTYEARSSMGYGKYNFDDFNRAEAQKGHRIAEEAVPKMVQNGDRLMHGQSPSEIAKANKRADFRLETMISFIPKEGADVHIEKGRLEINYVNKAVNVDWKNLQKKPLKFAPGSVEINIVRKPQVDIEYLGGPLYVPPSADPNN